MSDDWTVLAAARALHRTDCACSGLCEGPYEDEVETARLVLDAALAETELCGCCEVSAYIDPSGDQGPCETCWHTPDQHWEAYELRRARA